MFVGTINYQELLSLAVQDITYLTVSLTIAEQSNRVDIQDIILEKPLIQFESDNCCCDTEWI